MCANRLICRRREEGEHLWLTRKQSIVCESKTLSERDARRREIWIGNETCVWSDLSPLYGDEWMHVCFFQVMNLYRYSCFFQDKINWEATCLSLLPPDDHEWTFAMHSVIVCAPESACCYDALSSGEKDCDANEWNSCLLLQQGSLFVDGRVARNRLISLSPLRQFCFIERRYESRPWQIEGFVWAIYLWWMNEKREHRVPVSGPLLSVLLSLSLSLYLFSSPSDRLLGSRCAAPASHSISLCLLMPFN